MGGRRHCFGMTSTLWNVLLEYTSKVYVGGWILYEARLGNWSCENPAVLYRHKHFVRLQSKQIQYPLSPNIEHPSVSKTN